MPPIDYTLPLDQLPDPLPIEPLTRPFDVTITPPGSKSITCRAYVLAALAGGGGESKLIRPLRADDTDRLLEALCTLGAEARWEGEDVFIKGVGGRFPRGGNLYMGDGGTPTRFMIACACMAAEPVVIDASPRMRERPIAEGVEMLRQLGATIEYVEEEGRLPVRVTPSETLCGGELRVARTASSQFISAIMLIGAYLRDGLTTRFDDMGPTSESYVRLTLDLLGEWRVDVGGLKRSRRLRNIEIKVGAIHPFEYWTEADASSAVVWAVAAAIGAGNRVEIQGVAPDSKQPDIWLLDALEDLGMIVNGDESGIGVEGTGGWRAKDREVDKFDFSLMPDAAVPFAVSAASQSYRITLTGLRTLRVKETDRIAALANELRKVGCAVETGEDWIEITPPHAGSDERSEEDPDRARTPAQSGSSSLRSSDPAWAKEGSDPVIIETYNDHRMAMAFAVLGLVAPNGHRLAIRNPKCVAKSYPTFWKDFAKLYQ